MYIISCINLFEGWEKINKGSGEHFTQKYCNIHKNTQQLMLKCKRLENREHKQEREREWGEREG